VPKTFSFLISGTKYAKPTKVKRAPLKMLGPPSFCEDPSKRTSSIFANPHNKERDAIIVLGEIAVPLPFNE
jgi:hypothetical protein